MLIYISTMTFNNFCMPFSISKLFMHYCNRHLLYALFQLATFLCTTTAIIDNFCINNYNFKHIFSTITIKILSCNIWLFSRSDPAPIPTELEAGLVIFSWFYSHTITHPGKFEQKSCLICWLDLKTILRTQPSWPWGTFKLFDLFWFFVKSIWNNDLFFPFLY